MKLVQDHSLAAGNVTVPCLRDDCQGPHRMVRLCDALIDVEGPAFRAYYHVQCAPKAPVAPCAIDGCARPHYPTH